MKEDQLMTFSVTQTDGQKEFVRLFYPIYVGVDIGADFHVATCITPEQCQYRFNFPQNYRLKIPHFCRYWLFTSAGSGRKKPAFFFSLMR